MADATLSTKFSRRSMLAGSTAAALCVAPGVAVSGASTPAMPGPTHPLTLPSPARGEGLVVPLANPADALLALLAGQYRRVLADLCDCIAEAEDRGGVFAYWEEPYRQPYDALVARADELVAEIARLRPDSVFGLAVKLRLAVWRVDMDTLFDCDERLLMPALADADRMAEAALFGAGQGARGLLRQM